ncbi:MAG: hypothetical protein AAB677_03150 [Patescibacteria group bacterium]
MRELGRILATAFMLTWATCPMVFALENGKLTAKEEVERAMLVKYPLLGQITAMNIGDIMMDSRTITVTRPEATYVFDLDQFFVAADGAAGGALTVYDNHTGEVGEVFVSRVAMVGDNQIDFAVTIADSTGQQATEVGSIVGLTQNRALVTTSVDGFDANLSLVSFAADSSAPDAPVVITTTALTTSDSGSAASFWAWLTCAIGWTACTIVVIATVAFVGATCLAFGWWGCDR